MNLLVVFLVNNLFSGGCFFLALQLIYPLYITNKTEHFNFKSECVTRVAKRKSTDCVY